MNNKQIGSQMTLDSTEQKLSLLQRVLNEKLLEACQEGNYHKAKEALEQGAEVNCQDDDEYTPLHHAAVNCYYDIANLLLSKNAEVDNKDYYGETAMAKAYKSNKQDSLRMVNFLKQYGGEECSQIA